MKRQLVRDIGRSPRFAILELLKRSREGMAVDDLAVALKMSYMGVKAHCLEMEEQGYLQTWRQPGGRGRPRLLYRLTAKIHGYFSEEKNDLSLSLLAASKQLFGATAPQKLLMLHFRNLSVKYREQIKGTTVEERAQAFATLRDKEGHLSRFETSSPWQIIESHNPYRDLMEAYSEVEAFESQMMSEVIGTPVRRSVSIVAGLYRAVIVQK